MNYQKETYTLEKARSENLIAGKISFSPEIEEIEQLKKRYRFLII